MQLIPQQGVAMGKPTATITSMHICPKSPLKFRMWAALLSLVHPMLKLVGYLRLEKGTVLFVLVHQIP